ncbi:PQQ-dependent sugar dehydrogenase [Peristeroidobacter agariperforans]|uniref:PQQ-dependent sugar dehydrogenase n=1 Tax=Peristeroidobacter agariperforans TaxID=268404 RepID=UPI0018E50386|nr:PQQ-dependent sugar dehydrogenase [Peristeroidobacter agariperforans]
MLYPSGPPRPALRRRFCLANAWTVILTMLFGETTHATANVSKRDNGEPSYWVEQLANGLKFPSAIAWLPDGGILISERQGGLRILRKGTLDADPISGTPPSVQDLLNGIKDIALDPDFNVTRTLYILIAEGTVASHHAAVYRARLEQTTLRDVQRIFRSKEETNSGPVAGRLLFLADNTLLVALPVSGETAMTPAAQQLDSHIGKIIRIHRDGSVPTDNPFLRSPGALPEIWSIGHRVPMGLYEDRAAGTIWEVEAGPRGGDELNILKAGRNYGWPKATWGFDYSGALVAPTQTNAGFEDPTLVWTPSITPTSIVRYQGEIYPQWQGDYFIGSLTGKALMRVRINEGKVLLQERLLIDLNERIRTIAVGPDHHLYVLTDHHNGRILRINPGAPPEALESRIARPLPQPAFTDRSPVPGNAAIGKQAFVEACAACHSVGTFIQGGRVGPDLAGVYGRKAGAQKNFAYSSAMANWQHDWDYKSLNAFLIDPAAYLPGTAMSAAPIVDAELRAHLIEFLRSESQPSP